MDPRILVVTLEIVDMHEAFQRQKADQARERAQKCVLKLYVYLYMYM